MKKWPSPPRRRPVRKSRPVLEQLESRVLPSVSVTTYRNSDVDPGVNQGETQLTPANVNTNNFGKLYSLVLDGQVYAEPLIKTGVTITGGPNTKAGQTGVHDVVFVVTEHDTLYAIDSGPFGGQTLWQRTFLDATNPSNTSLGALGTSTVVTSVPNGDTGSADITPEIGITGTPVIDSSTNTLYVSVKTKETVGNIIYYVQRMHAISLSDGTDRVAPYLTGATTAGNTNTSAIWVYGTGDGSVLDPLGSNRQVVQFNALREANRGGLQINNGTLYEEWASHGDQGPYHGWIATWNIRNLQSSGFQLNGVFCANPNSGLTGIWQGGGILAMDPDVPGTFYFETGNGPTNHGNPTLNAAGFPADGSYWEAVVKLGIDTTTSTSNQNINGWGLKVFDYFIPYNVVALDNADEDLGSGAPLVLPDSAGITGHPHLLVAAGKEGKVYLIDRDNMGKFSTTGDHVVNAVPNNTGQNTAPVLIGGSLSTAAYYNGKVYWTSGYSSTSRSFTIGALITSSSIPYTYPLNTTSETAATSGSLPGSVSITANGTSNGIAWVMDRRTNEIHAFDAASFQTELWNSGMKVGDAVGSVVKFASPTEANGQVYVGTLTGLVVYGLATPPNAAPLAPTLSSAALSGSAVNLNWSDPTAHPNTASAYLIEESTDGSHYTQVASTAAGITSASVGGLAPATTYIFRIRGINGVGFSAYSNTTSATTTNLLASIDYSAGFNGAGSGLTLNGVASLAGSSLQLTPNIANLAGSAFASSPVDVTRFTSQFTLKFPAGNTTGGLAFVIQGVSPTAIGGPGGYLGYSDGGANIAKSVAVKFDLFSDAGEGPSSTGLYLNGAIPESVGSISLVPAALDFHSGDPFLVNVAYDGTTLSVLITDTVTGRSVTQSYAVNIPATVGSSSAYVGFTGSTGSLAAIQSVLNWTFSPNASQVPTAPTGLGGSAASATSINLTWNNNAANQTGFALDRATDVTFTQNLVTQNLPASAVALTDTYPGLAAGATYYYRIRATNTAGPSPYSNIAPVSIPLPPAAPTTALATDASISDVDIQWQDNAGRDATGYLIQRSVNGGPFADYINLPQLVVPDVYDWIDTNVSPGTTYTYRISAYNISGSAGFALVTVATLPVAPSGIAAIGGNGVTTVTWSAVPGAVTYNVYRATTSGGEGTTPYAMGVPGPVFVDTAAGNGVTYYYQVSAVNANAALVPAVPSEGALSNEVAATPNAGAPATPTSLHVVRGGSGQLVLTWNPASGATTYNVYRGVFAGGQAATPVATGLTTGGFTDSGLTNGTTYFYTVASVNPSGQSARSNEAFGNAEAPGTVVWIGGDAAGATLWSNTNNWLDHVAPVNGNIVRLDTTAGAIGSFTSVNDIANLSLGGLIINDASTVNSFTVSGLALSMTGGITSSTIGPVATIGVSSISVRAAATWTNSLGGLIITANVDLAGNMLTMAGAGSTSIVGTISSSISTSDSLVQAGPGVLILSATNSYDGITRIQGGMLVAGVNGALGATSAGTIVNTGGVLAFPAAGGVNYLMAEPLTLSGSGLAPANSGAIENLGGNNLFAGPINLGGPTTLDSDAGTLTLSGAIAENTSNLTVTGSGNTILGGVIGGGAFVGGLLETQINVANDFTDPAAGTASLGSDVVLYPQMAEQSNVQNGVAALPTIQHTWTNNDTWIYTGQINFPNFNNTGSGTLSFAKDVDDSTLLKIDGVTYINNTSYTTPIGTGPITLAAGWHSIEIRFGNGTGGAGADGQNNNGWTGWTNSIGFVYRVDNGPNDPKASSITVSDYVVPTDNGSGNLFRATQAPGLTKTGSGTLTLGAVNSYQGPTNITQGAVIAAVNGALSSATVQGANVAAGAALILPVGLAYTLPTPLVLAGSGIAGSGALESQGNAASYAGPITLSAVATIASDAGTFTLSGNSISLAGNLTVTGAGNFTITDSLLGTGGLIKGGGGTALLSGNNLYSGATTVNQGTLLASSSTALGSATSAVTVASGATLALQGGIIIAARPLTISGPGVGGVGALANVSGNNTYSGTITEAAASSIGSAAGTLTLPGAIFAGAGTLTGTGAGNITFNGVISSIVPGLRESQINVANDFTDSSAGTAALGSDFVLSPLLSRTNAVVNNVAALPTTQHTWTDNDTWIYTGQINFPNTGNSGSGTLSFAKDIDDSTLLKIDGVTYINNTSYTTPIGTGPITLAAGWHNIEIRFGNGTGGAGADGQNNNGWTGWNTSTGFVYRVDSGPGTTDAKASSLTVGDYVIPIDDGSGNLFRVLTSTGAFTKIGSGTATMAATNTYLGATAVAAGTLLLDGALPSSPVTIVGGTLGGKGAASLPVIASGGNIAPGDGASSTAALAVGSVSLSQGGSLNVELGGSAPGQFDQLVVGANGSVNLNGTSSSQGGAALNITLVGGFVPTVGQTFKIIDNQGASAVSGKFFGPVNQGGTILVGNQYLFSVSYTGGDGNDVVLTLMQIAGPATQLLVSAPPTATAGTPFTVTVTAQDSANRTAVGYTGTVHIATSGGAPVLPPDATLTNGVGSFLVTLTTAGTWAISAQDPLNSTITSVAGNIIVSAAAARSFTLAGPTSTVSTGDPFGVTLTATDAYGNLATGYTGTVRLTSTDPAANNLIANYTFTTGPGGDNGAHAFTVALPTAGSQTITATDVNSTNPVLTASTAPITLLGLTVSTFTPTPTGFTVSFSKPFVPADLTLFGPGATVADVTLVGAKTGSIGGTLIIDPSGTSFTFKATANTLGFYNSVANPLVRSVVLPDDTYTVTLRSGSGTNGFLDALGAGLDGGAIGGTGGGHTDFSTSFTTQYQASATPVLAVPDFARGPDDGHAIQVPNNGAAGIPVTLYNAAQVTYATFTLTYNPTLLNVTAGSSADAPIGSSFTLFGGVHTVDPNHATATFIFSSGTPQSGTVTLGDIVATVPSSAVTSYQVKELLDFKSIAVNHAVYTGVSAPGVHINAYFGDVSGDGVLNAVDVAKMSLVASAPAGLDTGFAAYQQLDPALIGDISTDISVDAGDLATLKGYLIRLPAPVIPAVPGLTGISSPNAADPVLTLEPLGAEPLTPDASPPSSGTTSARLGASGADSKTVAVMLDDPHPVGSTGLTEAVLALRYDPALVSVAAIGLGSLPAAGVGWQLSTVVDAGAGTIGIELYSTTPISSAQAGSLVNITFNVLNKGASAAMSAAVQLVDQVTSNGRPFTTLLADDEGALVLGRNNSPRILAGSLPAVLDTHEDAAGLHAPGVTKANLPETGAQDGTEDVEAALLPAPETNALNNEAVIFLRGEAAALPALTGLAFDVGTIPLLTSAPLSSAPLASAASQLATTWLFTSLTRVGDIAPDTCYLDLRHVSAALWSGALLDEDWFSVLRPLSPRDARTDSAGDQPAFAQQVARPLVAWDETFARLADEGDAAN